MNLVPTTNRDFAGPTKDANTPAEQHAAKNGQKDARANPGIAS